MYSYFAANSIKNSDYYCPFNDDYKCGEWCPLAVEYLVGTDSGEKALNNKCAFALMAVALANNKGDR